MVLLVGDYNASVVNCLTLSMILIRCQKGCYRFICVCIWRMFIDFMISTSMCMLNSRNYARHDFTCKGVSVVNYTII